MITFLIVYLLIGSFFVLMTQSRGIVADILFALFWPFYVYSYLKNGD